MPSPLFALLLMTAPASYDAPTADPGTVPLYLEADAGNVEFEVRAGKKAPVQTCFAPCTLWVLPGSYDVKMRGAEVSGAHERISVVGSTAVRAETRAKSDRIPGLVLGVAGGATAAIALTGVILSGCAMSECRDDRPNNTPWLVAAGVGAVASGVGWIMFGTSRSKLTPSYAPQMSMAPTRAGGFLALSGSF